MEGWWKNDRDARKCERDQKKKITIYIPIPEKLKITHAHTWSSNSDMNTCSLHKKKNSPNHMFRSEDIEATEIGVCGCEHPVESVFTAEHRDLPRQAFPKDVVRRKHETGDTLRVLKHRLALFASVHIPSCLNYQESEPTALQPPMTILSKSMPFFMATNTKSPLGLLCRDLDLLWNCFLLRSRWQGKWCWYYYDYYSFFILLIQVCYLLVQLRLLYKMEKKKRENVKKKQKKGKSTYTYPSL